MNVIQKFHSKWPIKNQLTYWEIGLFPGIMNPQLRRMKWQTVDFVTCPQGTGYTGLKAKAGLQFAHLVKQAHKEHLLLRKIYIYTHTQIYICRTHIFSFKKRTGWHRAQNCKVNTLSLKTPWAKISVPFHITGKQNDWVETAAMQVLSLIIQRFKYSLPLSSPITRELQHFIL